MIYERRRLRGARISTLGRGKEDLEPPTCRETCCPCLPKARPPPEEKDGATPLKWPSKSLDGEEGEKKDP